MPLQAKGEFFEKRSVCQGHDKQFILFGLVADAQKGMQKTKDDGDLGKQGQPGLFGGQPPIQVDALWLVVRVKLLGFTFEDPIDPGYRLFCFELYLFLSGASLIGFFCTGYHQALFSLIFSAPQKAL